MFKKIGIVCDHNGEEFKGYVASVVQSLGAETVLPKYETSGEDDYPDVYASVYKLFSTGKIDGLILLCGTGVGMCMCANKSAGVRCVWANDSAVAAYARFHENANALALGVNYYHKTIGKKVSLSKGKIAKIIKAFMQTEFSSEPRHARRVKKLDNLIKLDK